MKNLSLILLVVSLASCATVDSPMTASQILKGKGEALGAAAATSDVTIQFQATCTVHYKPAESNKFVVSCPK